jgi:VWFA-related protein
MKPLALLALAVLAVPGSAQQTQVFRGGADLVAVHVTVLRGNRPVRHLRAADFEVRDNGVLQTLTDLNEGTLPIDVRLVFDLSGSISNDQLAAYLRAMRQVTARLQADDRCEVLTFASRLGEAAALQPPPVAIDLRRPAPDGTSFYDAVSLALVTTPAAGRRQLIIVLTDGEDNASFFNAGTLLDVARLTDAVVYVVEPRTAAWNPGRPSATLAALAATTGGAAIALDRDGEVGPTFTRTLDEFRQSYVLHYLLTGVSRTGWHDLTVRVKRGSYDVRARKGYNGG